MTRDQSSEGPKAGTDPAARSVLSGIVDDLLDADMVRFREALHEALRPQDPYLSDVERRMFKGGKKIRPVMMLLAARMMAGDGPLSEKVYKGAASLEMLHVATLIHDDIIDEAQMRRGLPSVSAHRGPKVALLVGDLQFVQAIRGFAQAVDTERDMDLVRMVLDTAFDICRGELDELERALPADRDDRLDRYYETIDRKTAVLFRLACQAGIELAGGRTRDSRRGGFFGKSFGRAFQIMDDILDVVQPAAQSGKAPGIDLSLGRLSLPIIHALDRLDTPNAIEAAVRGEAPLSGAALDAALSELRLCGAVEEAYEQARAAAFEAHFYLKPFPRNAYAAALGTLTDYVVNRPLC